MRIPTEKDIELLQKMYPIGSRVELIRMDDIASPPVGTQGTVLGIDALGDLMVAWDNDSSLNLIFEVDECRKISD
ncbi:MAG: DUF4314 domain-containing protein [Clostridiales bacterium]|nr:DUF4314 domain-containing protein [Clostridiales bacterium]